MTVLASVSGKGDVVPPATASELTNRFLITTSHLISSPSAVETVLQTVSTCNSSLSAGTATAASGALGKCVLAGDLNAFCLGDMTRSATAITASSTSDSLSSLSSSASAPLVSVDRFGVSSRA